MIALRLTYPSYYVRFLVYNDCLYCSAGHDRKRRRTHIASNNVSVQTGALGTTLFLPGLPARSYLW